jgi:hypothetical protein
MLNSIIFVVVLMTVILSMKKYAKKLSKKYCCKKSDDLELLYIKEGMERESKNQCNNNI